MATLSSVAPSLRWIICDKPIFVTIGLVKVAETKVRRSGEDRNAAGIDAELS